MNAIIYCNFNVTFVIADVAYMMNLNNISYHSGMDLQV